MTRHERRTESRQIATEAACNVRDVLLGVLLYLLIATACVVGHSVVSARVAHGQMPVLYTETFIPQVSK